MRSIEETNKKLENIELLLSSILDYLKTPASIMIVRQEETGKSGRTTFGSTHGPASKTCENKNDFPSIPETYQDNTIPEMVTILEASNRTHLSYDFLRKQCLSGKLAHIRIGHGKFLINMGSLIEQLKTSHGRFQNTEQEE